MLVVIAVLAVIAAILFPVFAQVREQGRKIVCLSNERQLGMALLQYAADHDDLFPIPALVLTSKPYSGGWANKCYSYLKNLDVYHCPDDDTQPKVFNEGPWPRPLPLLPVSYGINSNLVGYSLDTGKERQATPGAGLPALTSPSRTLLLFEVSNDTVGFPDRGFDYDLSAAGNGAHDCSRGGQYTYPCGNGVHYADHDDAVTLYATGNIGGRALNGGGGSMPRHREGANYLACDGHARWLRPGAISGGFNAVAETCAQGDVGTQPAGCVGQAQEGAAGTGNGAYTLTFSAR
jgi:prepilin-type processing-associated H-X9-DG protein